MFASPINRKRAEKRSNHIQRITREDYEEGFQAPHSPTLENSASPKRPKNIAPISLNIFSNSKAAHPDPDSSSSGQLAEEPTGGVLHQKNFNYGHGRPPQRQLSREDRDFGFSNQKPSRSRNKAPQTSSVSYLPEFNKNKGKDGESRWLVMVESCK